MKVPPLRASFSSVARRRARPHVKIGIRSEDPARIWERRTPLTPAAVHELIRAGNASVDVVSCSKRVYKDEDYERAGAKIVKSLDNPDLVLGIKEPPVEDIKNSPQHKDSTHLMFSHTVKGQPYNMSLLSKFVGPEAGNPSPYPRLIDYELLTNEKDGKRTVGFGWYAGVAGVLEALSSMAQQHLELGVATPFLYTPRPHTLPSLDALRAALRAIGTTISLDGLPNKMGPFIIGLTGTGQVAEGALSMLKELPIQKVSDVQGLLQTWVEGNHDMSKTIYLLHLKPEDYLVRTDGKPYNREHYYQSPQLYKSVFHRKYAPYLTLFINGAGWSPSFPRLMTNDQLITALRTAEAYPGARLLNIADISCDVEGGLEFLTKATTLSSPFYKVRPPGLSSHLRPVQMMSVDILPAAIPLDASKHFSAALMPYVRELIDYQLSDRQGKYPRALDRATIAADGLLREKHQWLHPVMSRVLEEKERVVLKEAPPPPRKKRILMLGSGMVAQPAVDMIAKRPDVDLTILSNSLPELRALTAPHPNVLYHAVDFDRINEPAQGYFTLLRDTDVVISLLPAQMHDQVAQHCIKYQKHLVTASYVSTHMAALDYKAKQAGVLLLNEIGLDPGIDHCSALELISRLQKEGKKIESFISFCGGLPAPQDSHVPLRYKFSWRPQGVLTAALNSAQYLLTGKRTRVGAVLKHFFPSLPITPDFRLEGLPNRDSLSYIESYNLSKDPLITFVRGTLRYPGFSSLMDSFSKLGLLENERQMKELESWESLIAKSMTLMPIPPEDMSAVIPPTSMQPLQVALEWLGLVRNPILRPSQTSMPPLLAGPHTPLDVFAYLLSHKLKYQPDERDMVVLSHEIITREKYTRTAYTSTLISYGTQVPNHSFQGERPASAMARTVGFPVAIAALLVVDGKIALRGVQRPLSPDIYHPVLDGLKEVGLVMEETSREIRPGALTVESTLAAASGLRRDIRRSLEEPNIDPEMQDAVHDYKGHN